MSVATCDLYEGTYYLLHGCELETIEALKVDGRLLCRMTFSGLELAHLQVTYLQGSAEANLFRFRRAYSQLSSAVLKAKRKAQNRLKNGEGIPVLDQDGPTRGIR